MARAREFRRFDYGENENMIRYGQAVPPVNNLASIKDINIAIVSGASDVLSTLEDTRWAKETL